LAGVSQAPTGGVVLTQGRKHTPRNLKGLNLYTRAEEKTGLGGWKTGAQGKKRKKKKRVYWCQVKMGHRSEKPVTVLALREMT